jgi:Delta7-sterol 5-desaturase
MKTLTNALAGGNPLLFWFMLFIAAGLAMTVGRSYLAVRKIQPKGFKWKTFRNEIFFGVINVAISGAIIGGSLTWLTTHGFISVSHEPASWWVIVLEYAVYFLAFDTWFYWLHRWMHREPVYSWVHKLHHWSTAPNIMTNFSVNPLESLINGGFVPLFLVCVPVHQDAFALITPTNVVMGLWIHSGYEFFPRWWNRTWLTKWFITTTFHDQHHKFFTVNFGGYTTLWDRICGTMRPKYEAEFIKIKDRAAERSLSGRAKEEALSRHQS